jgi:hypothetical protein
MFVPLHDRHQVKQDSDTAEYKAQCDVAFAARAVCIVISHDHSAKDKCGSPISFSTIREANSAVI